MSTITKEECIKCDTCGTKLLKGVKYHQDRVSCILCKAQDRPSTLVKSHLRLQEQRQSFADGGYLIANEEK
jgi:hypothetical protein